MEEVIVAVLLILLIVLGLSEKEVGNPYFNKQTISRKRIGSSVDE